MQVEHEGCVQDQCNPLWKQDNQEYRNHIFSFVLSNQVLSCKQLKQIVEEKNKNSREGDNLLKGT